MFVLSWLYKRTINFFLSIFKEPPYRIWQIRGTSIGAKYNNIFQMLFYNAQPLYLHKQNCSDENNTQLDNLYILPARLIYYHIIFAVFVLFPVAMVLGAKLFWLVVILFLVLVWLLPICMYIIRPIRVLHWFSGRCVPDRMLDCFYNIAEISTIKKSNIFLNIINVIIAMKNVLPCCHDHNNPIYFSPSGSTHQSIVKMATADFLGEAKFDNNYSEASIVKSKSLRRLFFYWASPIWSSYLIMVGVALFVYIKDATGININENNTGGFSVNQAAWLLLSGVFWLLWSIFFFLFEAPRTLRWSHLSRADKDRLPFPLLSMVEPHITILETATKRTTVGFLVNYTNAILFALYALMLQILEK